MTPLVFRMAVPAVVAQLVNLLYNLVDRIYIGHIYGGRNRCDRLGDYPHIGFCLYGQRRGGASGLHSPRAR